MLQFVTASHLARKADLSVDSVRSDIRNGRLSPAARTESGAALFTLEQAERWAADRRSTKDAPSEAA